MRRVKRLPNSAAQGQGELFATYRYHAVFTDSPFLLVQAVAQGATIRAELIQVAARLYRAKTRSPARDLPIDPSIGQGMIMRWPRDSST